MPAFITDTRLCLDETKERVVDCDSPEARYLLAAEGSAVNAVDAERYGLGPDAPPAIPDEPPPGERFAAGTIKSRHSPPVDKAARQAQDKGGVPARQAPEDDA